MNWIPKQRTLQRWIWSLIVVGVLWGSSNIPVALAKKKKAKFVHRVPPTARAGKSVKIQGRILYGEDLDYAELRYRLMGSKGDFKSIKMSQKGELFYVYIPGKDVKPPGIEYYVVGVDFSGRGMILAGSVAAPLQFLVEEALDEGDTGGGEGDGRGEGEPRDGEWDSGRKGQKKAEKKIRGAAALLTSEGVGISARTAPLSPFSVTVITARDIDSYGWLTLRDVLRATAGVDINDRGSTADIGMRGINPPYNYGGGILFLLDGYDLSWRQLQANWMNPSWIGLDDIEKIEIYRHPVAGVWGRGSLYGSVQIYTKKPSKELSYRATAGGGPMSGTYFGSVRAGKSFKNGFYFSGSLSIFRDFRSPTLPPIYEFTNYPPDNPQNIIYRSPNDQQFSQNLYLRFGWKGLSLSIHQSHYDTTVPMGRYTPLGGDGGRYITDRFVVRAGWKGSLAKWGKLALWAAYDRYQLNRSSGVVMNPFAPAAGREEDAGSSQTYLVTISKKDPQSGKTITQNYFRPRCEALPPGQNKDTQCVRITTVEYTEKGKKRQEKACILSTVGTKLKERIQKVDLAQKGVTWFPLNICRPIYRDGRHFRRIRAEDNRISAGVALELSFISWLQIKVGLDIEYLQSTLWHFPATWKNGIDTALLTEEIAEPTLNNFRFGGLLQVEGYPLSWLGFTASARIDFDQRVGVQFLPLAGVVFNFPFGLFAKLHYSAGALPPSLYQLYLVEGNLYGNPTLIDETSHSIGLQIGWFKSDLLMVALNGFFSIFSSPIAAYNFDKKTEIQGMDLFEFPVKKPQQNYRQLINQLEGRTSLGGELEARLFPLAGLEMRGFFGLSLATEPIDDQGTIDRTSYASALYAGLNATYRYKLFRASLGFFYLGSKLLPLTNFSMWGTLPPEALENGTAGTPVPSWTFKKHPLAPGEEDIPRADAQFRLSLTLQFLQLFEIFDIVVRAQNILGAAMPFYDAGTPLLYPQKGFELFLWIRINK